MPASTLSDLTCTVHPMHFAVMKLQEFMKMSGMTDDAMAAAIGKDRSVVSKYRSGDVTPPLAVIAQIETVTKGAVSFRDFLPDSQRGAA